MLSPYGSSGTSSCTSSIDNVEDHQEGRLLPPPHDKRYHLGLKINCLFCATSSSSVWWLIWFLASGFLCFPYNSVEDAPTRIVPYASVYVRMLLHIPLPTVIHILSLPPLSLSLSLSLPFRSRSRYEKYMTDPSTSVPSTSVPGL